MIYLWNETKKYSSIWIKRVKSLRLYRFENWGYRFGYKRYFFCWYREVVRVLQRHGRANQYLLSSLNEQIWKIIGNKEFQKNIAWVF